MTLSSWTERAKLGALATAILLCLSTLLTTFSFGMGPRDLPRLQVQQARALCDTYEKKSLQQGQKCQRAMKHAYKRLNIGPCLPKEQQVVLCELEWCTATGTAASCRTECDLVRKSLRKCIDAQVQASLRYFGLMEGALDDTTTTVSKS